MGSLCFKKPKSIVFKLLGISSKSWYQIQLSHLLFRGIVFVRNGFKFCQKWLETLFGIVKCFKKAQSVVSTSGNNSLFITDSPVRDSFGILYKQLSTDQWCLHYLQTMNKITTLFKWKFKKVLILNQKKVLNKEKKVPT